MVVDAGLGAEYRLTLLGNYFDNDALSDAG
jgi:hypothetical protein